MKVKVKEEEGPPTPPPHATITLKLEKEKEGKGQILSHVEEKGTGDPIENATVNIRGPVDRTKKTDEDGNAVFKDVPAYEEYEVTAKKKGYKSDSGTIEEDDWVKPPGE